jgi:hypothetical protein
MIAIRFTDGEWERRRIFHSTNDAKLRQRLNKLTFDLAIELSITPTHCSCWFHLEFPRWLQGPDPMVSDCIGAAEAMDLLIRRDGLNYEQVFPQYEFRQP